MAVAMVVVCHGRGGQDIGRRHTCCRRLVYLDRASAPECCYLLSMCTLQEALDSERVQLARPGRLMVAITQFVERGEAEMSVVDCF
jgi:hypothetical protein